MFITFAPVLCGFVFQLLIVVSLSLYRMGASLVEVQCFQMLCISVVMTDSFFEAHLRYNVTQMELGANLQAFVKVNNQRFSSFRFLDNMQGFSNKTSGYSRVT